MLASIDYSNYFNELRAISEKYRKGIYAPSCLLINDMIALSDKFGYSDDELNESVPKLSEYGMQMVIVDEEYYVTPGSSVEEIKRRYGLILSEAQLDLELLYYLGTDEVARKYPETMEKLIALTFFAVEDVAIGLPVTMRTHVILRELLQDKHYALHPEDIERSKGWVDEETKEYYSAHAKSGYIPSSCLEAALKDLMIDFGDYPLCQNIVIVTAESMGLTSLNTTNISALSPIYDESELQLHLTKFLQDLDVDLEQCYKQGPKSLHQDILTLFRNHYFFCNAHIANLSDADLQAGNLLMKICQDEHDKIILDDAPTSKVIDEDMATTLRIYAKNGYVPSWIVSEQFDRLLGIYGNIADAGKVRDGTLDSLSVKPIMIEKDEYMLEGSSWESVKAILVKRVEQWDLEETYNSGEIPDKHSTEHNHLVSMIFFALRDIENLKQANEVFQDVLTGLLSNHHGTLHSDEVPVSTMVEVHNTIEKYRKSQYVPSWLRDRCIDLIATHVKYFWYAEHVYKQGLEQWDLHELEVHQDDYLTPGTSRDQLDDAIYALIKKAAIDLDYYVRNNAYDDHGAEMRTLIANVLYFADNEIDSPVDADQKCDEYVYQLSREYLEEHYPVDAKADSIVLECIDQYSKDHCLPSWVHDLVKERLHEAGVSDWMAETTIKCFDEAVEENIILIAKENTLPSGSSFSDIVAKSKEIITQSGMQVDQVQELLATTDFEDGRNSDSVITTLRALVLFADDTVSSTNDVDTRVSKVLSSLA